MECKQSIWCLSVEGRGTREEGCSHSVVTRPTAPFWNYPVDVLRWALNVARLAMDTVLGVYLQSVSISHLLRHIFVHSGWAKSERKEILNVSEMNTVRGLAVSDVNITMKWG